MAWYDGTYSCGHEGRTNIVGPTKNRDWIREKRFSGLCPECYEKNRLEKIEKENAEAAEKAKKYELPELNGTKNQIPWANTLRIKLIDKINDMIEHSKKANNMKDASLFTDIQLFLINEKTNSSWFINMRDYSEKKIISDILNEYKDFKKQEENNVRIKDIKFESTISPEEIMHTGIVEIIGDDSIIKAKYEKNETFMSIVKSLGYTWDGVWQRELKETTGVFADRAAELGNRLLKEGFSVCIYDGEIRNKAVTAEFESECKRWIYRKKDISELVLNWPRGESEEIYNNSRKIPTSKWDRPSVIVDVSHHEEVEEFANKYNFKFTEAARALINEYKNQIADTKKVSPKKTE